MKNIITEELRMRKRIVEYAIKHGNNAAAARKYHTSRQQVSRWRKRYDGTIDSLRPKSRRPHSHPNQHRPDEIELILKCYRRYRSDSLAEVFVQAVKRGYRRSYAGMLKVIKHHAKNKKMKKAKKYPKSKWVVDKVNAPGEKVQIDIKHVPLSCIGWDSHGVKYYQITSIDEYSRKRVCQIVDEKSVTNTARFLLDLEEKMGFKIQMVQTDNGREFRNDPEVSKVKSIFEEILESKGIKYKHTRPYSPWQNGKVERSHREDSEKFYIQTFRSLEELMKKHQRYINRGNNIARKVLGFKSPNQVIKEYYETLPC